MFLLSIKITDDSLFLKLGMIINKNIIKIELRMGKIKMNRCLCVTDYEFFIKKRIKNILISGKRKERVIC